ncbi:DUF6514 family protein [Zongyangia hominis]|uniref:Uncharacterized protein n=1 Tax=Zongyangia hominis TaxID=2763677 RepID=A0A926E8Y5_9FIRM|nr:DUF6514 family protein [Zongyangia hominis]MBC8569512.1 hypothetical protein [Zongyangia hominis]
MKFDMKNFYILTMNSFIVEKEKKTLYGIALIQDGKQALSYLDISTDRDFVEEFVRKCNQHELDPCHLPDVLYDYLP